ncbi:MAG: hypothetical protein Q9175_001700 [Cornicularia normoerica]
MPPGRSTGPTDQKGSLALIEVYASFSSANAAAKARLLTSLRKLGELDADIEEMEKDDETSRKMELKDGKLATSGAATPS